MSISEYVRYENIFNTGFQTYQRKTTKEEWTERLEFVYKSSKDYIALSKAVSDAYVNYIVYKNKHLYTDDKETTWAMRSYLYNIYYDEYKKRYDLKIPIVKAFKERFPSINNSASELEHYLDSCEVYASHRLKGIEYNLPFPVEDDPKTPEDFQLKIEVKPSENTSKSETTLEEFVELMRLKSKPLAIREKKTHANKHTLSILLTQEKEKTKKLQEIIKQNELKHQPST
jgi:hypothetical protein